MPTINHRVVLFSDDGDAARRDANDVRETFRERNRDEIEESRRYRPFNRAITLTQMTRNGIAIKKIPRQIRRSPLVIRILTLRKR
jgi:hypothetical protein